MTTSDAGNGFGKDSEIARYLSVHPKTLPRWDRKPELGFPKPVYLGGHKYRKWSEVLEWTRQAAASFARNNAA